MRRKPNPIAASALAILLAVPLPAYAQPSGGSVVVGGATITTPSANSTIIKQTTQSAIVNWQSFSIETGSSVQFNQPNAAAITLNRVLGGGLSQINGALTANGQVWIINQNGILFGKGSQINVSGLLATTSDIADADFSAGNYNFNSASPNAAASIDNAGTIHIGNGGSAVLSASHVGNTGLIQADAGQIVLGGANAFTVDFDGDNLLRYAITTPVATAPTDASGNAQKALVENSGTLTAAGGRILMTARAATNVADNVVNNSGIVSASSASVQNGEVILDAGDGSVQAGGTISATGTAAGQTGGNITLAGSNVTVADNAVVDASGDAGGGTISVGGGLHGSGTLPPAQTTTVGNATIAANANSNGNGGTVSVWSTGNTSIAGSISARGGSQSGDGGTVETSGHALSIDPAIAIDTTSAHGLLGNWLLDPTNLRIEAGSPTNTPQTLPSPGTIGYASFTSVIGTAVIDQALTSTNVTLQAVDDITVNAAINGSGTGRTLTLDAGRSIILNAGLNMTGNGGTIVLSADNPAANRVDSGAAIISGTGVVSADSIQLQNASNGADGGSIGTSSAALLIGAGNVTISTGGAGAFIQGSSATTGLTLGNVNVAAGALHASSPGNLSIASGATIVSSASGDAVVLSAAQNFVNNSGSGAISLSGSGRFLIYSASPSGDTFGGLNSGNTAVWHTTYPTAISQTGNHYVFASQPTLTFTSNNVVKTYGANDVATVAAAYTVSGFDPGVAGVYLADNAASTFTGTPTVTSAGSTAGATVAGGPYLISVAAGSVVETSGYGLLFTSTGQLTVNPAALLITASNQSMTYGGSMPTLTASYSGFVNGDTAASLTTAPTVVSGTAATANAGTYTGTLTASGAVDSNYAITYAAGTLTINKAALLITANNQSMTYGGSMPTLTASYSGFVNGDTVANLTTAPTVVSGTAATANAGTYAGTITASGALDSNYAISYTAGTLTINKAALLITANNQSMTYGGSMPTLTASYSGFVNGDTVASLTTAPTVASGTAATANAGTYAGTITASGALDSNYAISYAAGTLTINKAALLITANPLSKIYGQADPTLTYTASGLVNGDTSAVFTGSLTRAAGENVGGYAISQGSLAANSNYTIAFSGNTLNITPATLSISANTETKVYGQSDPALSYVATGFQFSDSSATVLTGSLTRAAGENVGGYAIGQGSLAANSNYTIAFTGNTLHITPATLTVTANPLSKVYGTTDPALTYTASGFEFTDNSATVLSGSLTRAAGESVGNYAIGQGSLVANANYTIAFSGANFAITQALLTITANPLSKVYGQADPTLTYTASGFENGDTVSILTGSLTRAAGENVGSYAISQGTLGTSANYTIAFTGSTLSITPAQLTISANGQSKVYGQADPALTYIATGFEFSDSSATVLSGSLTRTAGQNVGGYAITQGTLASNSNYTIAFSGNTLNITPAQLTISANGQSKVYGQADPALTYTASGFQYSDTGATVLTGSLTRAAGENVGGYAILQGSLASNSNYTIAFSGNTLNITPATLSISANTETKVYGQSDPALSYVATGFEFSDTSATVLTGSLTRAAGENVGGYAIGQGSLAANSNYTIAFSGNTLNITPATLTYVAASANRTYGSANPTFAGSVSGFVNGDTLATATTGSVTFTSTATATSNVGTYAIDGSGLTATNGNYVFAQAAANATALTINPATLTYVATAGSIETGTAIPTLTGTVTGFVNGETQATVTTGTLIFTTAATPSSPVGVYAINGSGLSANNGNYVFAQDPGNATALEITANTTLTLPPEFNNVVTIGVQNSNGSNDPNSPLTLPTTGSGDDTSGGLYTVTGHTPKGLDQPGANTVVVNGPIAQLVADTVVGTGFAEVPTSADLASSSLGTHFISSYHDNFSSWGNDAFWQ